MNDWLSIINLRIRGNVRGRPRMVGLYGCGHPKMRDNSIGHVQPRCRICKREASERYRKANPDYFKKYRQEHRQYFIDYLRAYRGANARTQEPKK